MRRILPILLPLVLLPIPAAAQGESSLPALTPQEELGKRIYLSGDSPSGNEIIAWLGDGGMEVPGAVMPCANCHGRDGKGRPEGGVSPGDLTWRSLTRADGGSGPNGRTFPPYDENTLKRAIAMGLDPAGNPLHVAMPRYRMSTAELAALVSYLKRLEDEPGD